MRVKMTWGSEEAPYDSKLGADIGTARFTNLIYIPSGTVYVRITGRSTLTGGDGTSNVQIRCQMVNDDTKQADGAGAGSELLGVFTYSTVSSSPVPIVGAGNKGFCIVYFINSNSSGTGANLPIPAEAINFRMSRTAGAVWGGGSIYIDKVEAIA